MGGFRCYPISAKGDAGRRLLTTLQKACLPSDRLYFPEDGVWWLMDHGSLHVGFACATPSLQHARGIYLSRSGLLPAYRGRGLQKRLIRVRLNWARKAGYKIAVSDTTDNHPSANNLIACGFRLYTPPIEYGYSKTLYWKRAL